MSVIWFVATIAAGLLLLKLQLPLCATSVVAALTVVRPFSARVMARAATTTVRRDSEPAAGLGRATGIGRTGAVLGP
ncbi:hypothetical protein [Streptomyces prunicolor]|uniref:Uncharacterized protein n=1 Tax=Streptomyces prunicolor TaxID=67348 RepID=A0ABU4F159_9ACTN|nr:hypothetical protein [Streptomyces prunicolor]MDV7214336.1 hypothetical protein [Streptomyces prunicolor]